MSHLSVLKFVCHWAAREHTWDLGQTHDLKIFPHFVLNVNNSHCPECQLNVAIVMLIEID